MSGASDIYRDRSLLGRLPLLDGQKAIVNPYRALVGDADTLGLWHFDEGLGNVVDSVLGHELAITGATWSTGWIFGKSLSFDGTDDFGTYAHALLYNQTNFSIEVLVRSSVDNDQSPGEDPIYVEGTTSNVRLRFGRQDDKLMFGWLNATGTAWLDYLSTPDVVWTNWNYLVGTSANKARVMYINGANAGGDTAATAPYATGMTTTYICKYPEAGQFGTFELAYLRISNIARTATEILNNARLMGF
jgi:hypothetical protein